MRFLPIVERELRVASRERKTHLFRVSTAFVASVVAGSLLFNISALGGSSFGGRQLFVALTGIGFYGCLMAGVAYSADAISRENREGTLGLLFLTDLKGYDVVLGKLTAASLISFLALFATFPVLALPLMLGGVTWLQFLSVFAALGNTLFFSHALTLLVSTVYQETQKAMSAAVLFLISVVAGLPFVQYLPFLEPFRATLSKTALFSPGYCFYESVQGPGISCFASLVCSHLLAWTFLLFASYRVKRCWQVKSVTTIGWRARWSRWVLGSPEFRLNLRRQLLDQSGYLWLISRSRFKRVGVWTGFVIVIFALAFLHNRVAGGWASIGKAELLVLMFALHAIVRIAVAGESSRHLDRQKRNGELELLLSATPLCNKDILGAHDQALKRLFLGPLVFVLGVDALLLVWGCSRDASPFMGLSANLAYVISILSAVGLLLFDLWSLRWVGLWSGLAVRRPGQGMGNALSRIFSPPFLLFVVFRAPLAFISRTGASAFFLYLTLWMLIRVANNVAFVWWAKSRLRTDLRVYVLPIGDEQLTWLGKLGRFLGICVRRMK